MVGWGEGMRRVAGVDFAAQPSKQIARRAELDGEIGHLIALGILDPVDGSIKRLAKAFE